MFWHTFGALTSIGLIVYFSLPAAITAGELSRYNYALLVIYRVVLIIHFLQKYFLLGLQRARDGANRCAFYLAECTRSAQYLRLVPLRCLLGVVVDIDQLGVFLCGSAAYTGAAAGPDIGIVRCCFM